MDQTVQAMLGMAAGGGVIFLMYLVFERRWSRDARAEREAAAQTKK